MVSRETKKIAVLGLSYPFRGGIAHYSTLLVRELRKKYCVKFFTLHRQYPAWLFPGKTQYDYSAEKLVEENSPIIDSLNPITWFKTFFILKNESYDLIIIQWWHPFFGLSFGTIANLVSLFSQSKICFLCHNVSPHESTLLDRILSRYAFLGAKCFIVHSDSDKKNLLSMKNHAIVKQNIHPTYSVFSEFAVYEKEKSKEILHIEKDKSVLLFFGLIRSYKGLEYLIYAMPEIIKYKKDCILLIVGEFYEPKEKYITLINSLNIDENVIVIDQYINNEDVPLYFCCADVVVLPYVEASQSGIIQIAFGLEKPVITTNAGGLPEVVEDGKTGFIVEKKSSAGLAEAVIKFYAEQCESPFRQEIKKRSHIFSWNTELQTIESFFAE